MSALGTSRNFSATQNSGIADIEQAAPFETQAVTLREGLLLWMRSREFKPIGFMESVAVDSIRPAIRHGAIDCSPLLQT